MVGRTIDREIERDLHSAFSHFALEPIEIFERPQRGLHRFVTASFASDRPGHAGIAWFCSHGIVSPFAISMSDRMNRREINYVEAHRLRVINSGQTITKGRSAIAATFGRAWKKFIPGSDLRFFPFHDHAWRRRILCRPRTVGIGRHQHFELARVDNVINLRVISPANRFRQFAKSRRIVRDVSALSGRFDQGRAFQCFSGQIGNAGFEFFRELIPPTSKGVGPRFDRVFINADLVQRTNPAPAIVVDKRHRCLMPARLTNQPPFQSGGHDIVTVFKNVGFDRKIVFDDAFDRVTSAVTQRPKILDNRAGKDPSHGPSIN